MLIFVKNMSRKFNDKNAHEINIHKTKPNNLQLLSNNKYNKLIIIENKKLK